MGDPWTLIAIGFIAGVIVTSFLAWAACATGGPKS